MNKVQIFVILNNIYLVYIIQNILQQLKASRSTLIKNVDNYINACDLVYDGADVKTSRNELATKMKEDPSTGAASIPADADQFTKAISIVTQLPPSIITGADTIFKKIRTNFYRGFNWTEGEEFARLEGKIKEDKLREFENVQKIISDADIAEGNIQILKSSMFGLPDPETISENTKIFSAYQINKSLSFQLDTFKVELDVYNIFGKTLEFKIFYLFTHIPDGGFGAIEMNSIESIDREMNGDKAVLNSLILSIQNNMRKLIKNFPKTYNDVDYTPLNDEFTRWKLTDVPRTGVLRLNNYKDILLGIKMQNNFREGGLYKLIGVTQEDSLEQAHSDSDSKKIHDLKMTMDIKFNAGEISAFIKGLFDVFIEHHSSTLGILPEDSSVKAKTGKQYLQTIKDLETEFKEIKIKKLFNRNRDADQKAQKKQKDAIKTVFKSFGNGSSTFTPLAKIIYLILGQKDNKTNYRIDKIYCDELEKTLKNINNKNLLGIEMLKSVNLSNSRKFSNLTLDLSSNIFENMIALNDNMITQLGSGNFQILDLLKQSLLPEMDAEDVENRILTSQGGGATAILKDDGSRFGDYNASLGNTAYAFGRILFGRYVAKTVHQMNRYIINTYIKSAPKEGAGGLVVFGWTSYAARQSYAYFENLAKKSYFSRTFKVIGGLVGIIAGLGGLIRDLFRLFSWGSAETGSILVGLVGGYVVGLFSGITGRISRELGGEAESILGDSSIDKDKALMAFNKRMIKMIGAPDEVPDDNTIRLLIKNIKEDAQSLNFIKDVVLSDINKSTGENIQEVLIKITALYLLDYMYRPIFKAFFYEINKRENTFTDTGTIDSYVKNQIINLLSAKPKYRVLNDKFPLEFIFKQYLVFRSEFFNDKYENMHKGDTNTKRDIKYITIYGILQRYYYYEEVLIYKLKTLAQNSIFDEGQSANIVKPSFLANKSAYSIKAQDYLYREQIETKKVLRKDKIANIILLKYIITLFSNRNTTLANSTSKNFYILSQCAVKATATDPEQAAEQARNENNANRKAVEAQRKTQMTELEDLKKKFPPNINIVTISIPESFFLRKLCMNAVKSENSKTSKRSVWGWEEKPDFEDDDDDAYKESQLIGLNDQCVGFELLLAQLLDFLNKISLAKNTIKLTDVHKFFNDNDSKKFRELANTFKEQAQAAQASEDAKQEWINAQEEKAKMFNIIADIKEYIERLKKQKGLKKLNYFQHPSGKAHSVGEVRIDTNTKTDSKKITEWEIFKMLMSTYEYLDLFTLFKTKDEKKLTKITDPNQKAHFNDIFKIKLKQISNIIPPADQQKQLFNLYQYVIDGLLETESPPAATPAAPPATNPDATPAVAATPAAPPAVAAPPAAQGGGSSVSRRALGVLHAANPVAGALAALTKKKQKSIPKKILSTENNTNYISDHTGEVEVEVEVEGEEVDANSKERKDPFRKFSDFIEKFLKNYIKQHQEGDPAFREAIYNFNTKKLQPFKYKSERSKTNRRKLTNLAEAQQLIDAKSNANDLFATYTNLNNQLLSVLQEEKKIKTDISKWPVITAVGGDLTIGDKIKNYIETQKFDGKTILGDMGISVEDTLRPKNIDFVILTPSGEAVEADAPPVPNPEGDINAQLARFSDYNSKLFDIIPVLEQKSKTIDANIAQYKKIKNLVSAESGSQEGENKYIKLYNEIHKLAHTILKDKINYIKTITPTDPNINLTMLSIYLDSNTNNTNKNLACLFLFECLTNSRYDQYDDKVEAILNDFIKKMGGEEDRHVPEDRLVYYDYTIKDEDKTLAETIEAIEEEIDEATAQEQKLSYLLKIKEFYTEILDILVYYKTNIKQLIDSGTIVNSKYILQLTKLKKTIESAGEPAEASTQGEEYKLTEDDFKGAIDEFLQQQSSNSMITREKVYNIVMIPDQVQDQIDSIPKQLFSDISDTADKDKLLKDFLGILPELVPLCEQKQQAKEKAAIAKKAEEAAAAAAAAAAAEAEAAREEMREKLQAISENLFLNPAEQNDLKSTKLEDDDLNDLISTMDKLVTSRKNLYDRLKAVRQSLEEEDNSYNMDGLTKHLNIKKLEGKSLGTDIILRDDSIPIPIPFVTEEIAEEVLNHINTENINKFVVPVTNTDATTAFRKYINSQIPSPPDSDISDLACGVFKKTNPGIKEAIIEMINEIGNDHSYNPFTLNAFHDSKYNPSKGQSNYPASYKDVTYADTMILWTIISRARLIKKIEDFVNEFVGSDKEYTVLSGNCGLLQLLNKKFTELHASVKDLVITGIFENILELNIKNNTDQTLKDNETDLFNFSNYYYKEPANGLGKISPASITTDPKNYDKLFNIFENATAMIFDKIETFLVVNAFIDNVGEPKNKNPKYLDINPKPSNNSEVLLNLDLDQNAVGSSSNAGELEKILTEGINLSTTQFRAPILYLNRNTPIEREGTGTENLIKDIVGAYDLQFYDKNIKLEQSISYVNRHDMDNGNWNNDLQNLYNHPCNPSNPSNPCNNDNIFNSAYGKKQLSTVSNRSGCQLGSGKNGKDLEYSYKQKFSFMKNPINKHTDKTTPDPNGPIELVNQFRQKLESNVFKNVVLFVFGITGSGKDSFLNHIYSELSGKQIDDRDPEDPNYIEKWLSQVIDKESNNSKYNIDNYEESWHYIDCTEFYKKNSPIKNEMFTNSNLSGTEPPPSARYKEQKERLNKFMRKATPFNKQSTRGFNIKKFGGVTKDNAAFKKDVYIINVPGFEPPHGVAAYTQLDPTNLQDTGEILVPIYMNNLSVKESKLIYHPKFVKGFKEIIISSNPPPNNNNLFEILRGSGMSDDGQKAKRNLIRDIILEGLFIVITLNYMSALLINNTGIKNQLQDSNNTRTGLYNTLFGNDGCFMSMDMDSSIFQDTDFQFPENEYFKYLNPFETPDGNRAQSNKWIAEKNFIRYTNCPFAEKIDADYKTYADSNDHFLKRLFDILIPNGKSVASARMNVNVIRPLREIYVNSGKGVKGIYNSIDNKNDHTYGFNLLDIEVNNKFLNKELIEMTKIRKRANKDVLSDKNSILNNFNDQRFLLNNLITKTGEYNSIIGQWNIDGSVFKSLPQRPSDTNLDVKYFPGDKIFNASDIFDLKIPTSDQTGSHLWSSKNPVVMAFFKKQLLDSTLFSTLQGFCEIRNADTMGSDCNN